MQGHILPPETSLLEHCLHSRETADFRSVADLAMKLHQHDGLLLRNPDGPAFMMRPVRSLRHPPFVRPRFPSQAILSSSAQRQSAPQPETPAFYFKATFPLISCKTFQSESAAVVSATTLETPTCRHNIEREDDVNQARSRKGLLRENL